MTDLRAFAHNRPCMIRLPGICRALAEATVLAHVRIIDISGMNLKAPDLLGAWACDACHYAVDTTGPDLTRELRELALLRGVMRTQYELIRLGIVSWSRPLANAAAPRLREALANLVDAVRLAGQAGSTGPSAREWYDALAVAMALLKETA